MLLPKIDQLVDATVGFEYLSSLDAYSRYHSMLMDREDEEKMAFVIDEGTLCYKVILFGLKNVDRTYQRMMTKVFKKLIRRNMEVYMDDILVKSLSFE